MIYIKAYLGFLLVFLLVDAVWISTVVKKIYAQDVSHLMTDSPNMVAAVIFYLFYAAGVILLAVKPALNTTSLSALLNGAILGALAYGTYTFTNLAVLQGWTAKIAITDVLWGAFLTGIAAWAAHVAATKL